MISFHPLIPNVIKPERVFLYGASPHIPLFATFLERAGIAIAGAVGFVPFADVPEVDLDRVRRSPDVPMVITTGSLHVPPVAPTPGQPDAAFSFKSALLQLLAAGLPNRLLHPSFVADFLDFHLHNAAYVAGFPGSGNILAQRVVAEIVESHKVPVSREEGFLAHLGQNFDHQLLSAIVAPLDNAGRRRLEMTSFGLGYTNYLAEFAEGWVHVNDIRCRRHFYQKIYGTHALFTPETVTALARLNYPVFICTRHPLDVVVSIQHKAGEGMKELEGFDVERMLESLAENANFLWRAIRNCGNFHLIRYEDLLTSPVETITAMAAHLNIDIAPQKAAEIWQMLGMKPLPGAPPGHFRAARILSWRDALDDETKARLRASGHFAYFRRLGYTYDIEPADLAALRQGMASAPEPKCSQRAGAAVFDGIWLSGDESAAEKRNALRRWIDTAFFRALARSGDYGLPEDAKVAGPALAERP